MKIICVMMLLLACFIISFSKEMFAVVSVVAVVCAILHIADVLEKKR